MRDSVASLERSRGLCCLSEAALDAAATNLKPETSPLGVILRMKEPVC